VKRVTTPVTEKRPVRVLLVEDDPSDIFLFQAVLSEARAGIELTAVDRLSAAVQALQESPIDLIVTDLSLPDSGEASTFRELRKHAPQIPIIVLSGYDAEDIAMKCVEQGAQDYLVKGQINPPVLLRSIRYALERHRAQTELRRAHDLLEEHVAERTRELAHTAAQLEDATGQLRQAQQRMLQHERLHALGRMASGIAHDFNNALAPIVGFSELLLHPSPTVQRKSQEYLQLIHTAATDGAEVVRRLREFYRYRDEHDVFAPVALNELIRQVIALTKPRWRDQALGRGCHIELVTEFKRIPPVTGSEAELREMLINVIFNAVDAIERDGTITCRTFRRGSSVIVQINDTGVGMAEDVRLRCFEPFFSTKADHGTGLGMAMVFGIVRRHEGEIEVESSPGLGTTISISLLPHEEIKGTASAAGAPQTSRPARILVVDDEPSVREVLQACFQEDGHFVGLAADGQEGLERFMSGQWDIVVTDRAMPRLNGDQLAAEIKKIRPDVPVILVTGFADVMHDVGDHPPEIDMILAKPFTRNALRQAVGQVLTANGKMSAAEELGPTAPGEAQQGSARPGTADLERSNQRD
jgi:signal transduction histidine kinase